jgi:hypothetical protein
MTEDNGTVRTFDTGATRDTAQNKPEYAGFLSPLVLQSFGRYMHQHRFQSDGSLRDSDNWQKGIPVKVYEQSLFRHWMDVWSLLRGYKGEQTQDIEEALNGMMFNVQGLLFEYLKGRFAGGDRLVELIAETPQVALHDIPCPDSEFHKGHDAHVWEATTGDLYNCGGYPSPLAEVCATCDGTGGIPGGQCDDPCPHCEKGQAWTEAITRPVWQSPPDAQWGGGPIPPMAQGRIQ